MHNRTQHARWRKATGVFAALLLLLLASGAQAADISWINASGGNFSEETNWSTGTVPGPSDNAFIILGGTYTVVLDGGATVASLTLGGASGNQTLAMSSDLTASGAITINANGVLNHAGGELSSPATNLSGVDNWTGGTINGTFNVVSGGRLTIGSTGSTKYLEGTINNAGLAVWSNAAGNDNIYGNGNFNNTTSFVNEAPLSSYHSLQVALNNTGTVTANSGQLDFYDGSNGRTGVSSGAFNANAGALITFSVGQHILNAGASFGGAGVTRILGGEVLVQGSVTSGPGTFEMTGGELFGPGTLSIVNLGTFNWRGGTIGTTDTSITNGAVSVASGSRLNIGNSGSTKYLEGTINNTGLTVWSNAAGNDNIYGNGNFNNQAGGVFNNLAALSSYHSLQVAFNNAGTVNAQSGQLDFYDGSNGRTGVSTGVFNVSADSGTSLTFSVGQHILNAGASFAGGGSTRILGGQVLLQGNASVAGILELSGGELFGPGTATINSGGTFNWRGGTIGTTDSSVTNGAVSVAAGGRLNIGGVGSTKYLEGSLNNAGVATWSNSGSQNDNIYGNGNFNNLVGGVFNNLAAVSSYHSLQVAFNNAGTVNAQSGLLDFYDGSNGRTGTSTGVFNATGTGLRITFSVGQHILNAGARFSGPGTTRISGGEVLVQGSTTNAGILELTGGELNGPGLITVASGGKLLWSAGTMDGPGATSIARGGLFNLLGTSTRSLGRDVTNVGTTTFVGTGGLNGFDGQGITFINAAGGVLNTAPRSITYFSEIDVINSGTINPGGTRAPGTLAIDTNGQGGGNFTQTSGGTLAIEVGGLADSANDRVTAEGRAALSGALQPSFLGSFLPISGSRLTFLSYTTRTGAFSRILGGALPGGRVLGVAYPQGKAEILVSVKPIISSVTPIRGIAGTLVTVTGANFADATRVLIGDTPVIFARVGTTVIRFVIPPIASSGKVTVTNAAGTTISAATITIIPTIKSFTPAVGPVGTSVLIIGTNLSGATSVKFNGREATFTRISATQVRASVPAGATSGRISVTTPGGTAISAGIFIVGARPTINGVSPRVVLRGGILIVTGTNLLEVTRVSLGDRVNPQLGVTVPFTRISATQLRVTVPVAITAGTKFVTVTAPGGQFTSPIAVTVALGRPSITTFTNPIARVAGGAFVYVYGANIGDATRVLFNGVAGTILNQYRGTGVLGVKAPANITPGRITVITPGGTVVSTRPYQVRVGSIIIGPSTRQSAPATSAIKLSTLSAEAASNSLSLKFDGPLDAASASDPAKYLVLVNGVEVEVESASYKASTSTVTLSVPASTWGSGDSVQVSWSNVLDQAGALASGKALAAVR